MTWFYIIVNWKSSQPSTMLSDLLCYVVFIGTSCMFKKGHSVWIWLYKTSCSHVNKKFDLQLKIPTDDRYDDLLRRQTFSLTGNMQ